MPTISMFYGILIQMYWDEYARPHFHAIYGEYKASVDIKSLTVSEGALPRRATQLVLDWDRCQNKQQPQPQPIEPLK